MPETLAAVWTEISSFFTTAFGTALTTLTALPILCAPLVIVVASRVLGMGKGLLKIGGRKGK